MKHTFNRTLLVILTLLALAFGSLGVAPAEAAPATQPVYLRSINGSPWGQATNEQAMNTAFGAGNWTALFYETVDPAVLFSPTYDLIFIEGSDSYATQMENFLNANRTLMENWVNSGGRLFLNSAPNQDNGMLYGFGGVQLLCPNYNSNTGIAVNPGHAIFNGPYTPAGTNYTGGSFSHASIAGGGITPLMSGDSGRIPLAEKQWGNGWVLFGGMTTTNYHSPQPNAMNLRANMLAYLKNQGAGFGLGVDPSSYDFGNQGTGTSSAPYTFTATNGDTPTTIGTLSISGEFSLSDDQCSGQTLGAGVSCTFDVVFSPATSGAKSGSVSIPNNGPASPIVVNLSGTGIVPPPTVDILSPITSNGFDLFSTIDIADPQGDPLSGSVDIVRTKTPSSVTFQTLTTCGSPNTLNLTLNGVTVGTSATPANCTCTPGVVTDVFSGSPITTNYLPFANNTWGYNSSGASTYTAWAKAIIQFSDGSSQTACLFDRTGSGCTNTDLCTGYLYGPASGTSIQPSTGTLFASQAYSNSSLPASLDTSALASGSYTLQASASDGSTTVTDSEPFTLAGEANLYINGGPSDTTAPSVDSFAATSPSPSLDIPITAFTASDDTGVTGYLITESATPPAAGDAGWSGTAPTTYTVAAAGTYDLYPWAKDAAGNVSAVCGPVTVDVIVANALDFDGANDYVDNGAGLLAQPFTTMTVEFWYKTPVGTGTYMQTVGRAYTTWEVQFHQLGTINLYINSQEYQSTAQRPLDSNWHHLAVTFNDATNEIKYYIDGAQLGSTITATQSIPNNANPLNIGRRSVYGGEYFNGTIDEVRIWDVVRTQGEIQASMNSELSAQAGLVALYHFNQGVPNGNNAGVTTLLDEGGNSRNGTLYNFALNGATSNWVDGYVAPSDTTPPVLSLPGNMTVEATGPAGAVVTFSATATDETSPANPAVACDANSGDTFPLGTTTVTCSATDDAGNTANGSFDITVEDTTAPVVSVPADITTEATGPAGAAVTFAAATASDIVDGPLTPVCDANSGDTFPLGTTTVTCSATDNAGNKGSASFDITVEDTTAPVVTVPANITAEATGPSGAAVNFSVSADDLVDGPLTPVCDANSGDTFPLGTTTVTCSATDAAGNTGFASFDITVQDTTAPDLTVPGNMTAVATSPAGADVTFSATAADLVDPAPVVTCNPPSGSTFPIGTTTVSCSASDAAGNISAPQTFDVTVTTPGVSLDPVSHDFGSQAVGATSAAQPFTLTNSGSSDLTLGTLSVSGDFALANDLCSGQTLAPQAACTFGATFSPTASGSLAGQVSIPSDAFSSPDIVPLSGVGFFLAPVAVTNPASSISLTGATLNGTINPNFDPATVSFEYGLTNAYGSTVAADQSPVSGGADTPVSASISGLLPNTTYHFRVVAQNSAGTTYGANLTFDTGMSAPTAVTDPASGIGNRVATLNGTVNAMNDETTVAFEYGLDASYGNTVSASPSPVNGAADTPVSAALSGLLQNTTYHFRAVAANSQGTTYGEDMTFTTTFAKLSKSFKSNGSQDGWTLESAEDSKNGGASYDGKTMLGKDWFVGLPTPNPAADLLAGDDDFNRQFRSIVAFDTASLPDNAVIVSVTLKLKKQGLVGSNPFDTHKSLLVDVKKPFFGPSASLAPADFHAAASRSSVGQFARTPANGWYKSALKPVAFAFINLGGNTQFRIRFQVDDNNDMGADYLRFYGGDAAPAYQPVLVIEYYLP